jgi:hypothetical protein
LGNAEGEQSVTDRGRRVDKAKTEIEDWAELIKLRQSREDNWEEDR